MESILCLLLGVLLLALYLYFVETKRLYLHRIFIKIFYSFKVSGLEHFPKDGPCLVIGNHVSYLDWLFLMIACPRKLHFVIFHSFYNSKLLSAILKKVETIPISGSHPKLIVKALEKVSSRLKNNEVVFVFPEGGITRENKIKSFRPGVLRVRRKHKNCPVVPIFIDGMWGSFFSYSGDGLFSLGKLSLKRRKVHLRMGPPLIAEDLPVDLLFDTVIGLNPEKADVYAQ